MIAVVLLLVAVVVLVGLGGGDSGRSSGKTRAEIARDTEDIALYGAPVKHHRG